MSVKNGLSRFAIALRAIGAIGALLLMIGFASVSFGGPKGLSGVMAGLGIGAFFSLAFFGIFWLIAYVIDGFAKD